MSIYKSNYRCKRSDVDNTVSLDIVLENKNENTGVSASSNTSIKD